MMPLGESFHVGKKSSQTTEHFAGYLAKRLPKRTKLHGKILDKNHCLFVDKNHKSYGELPSASRKWGCSRWVIFCGGRKERGREERKVSEGEM